MVTAIDIGNKKVKIVKGTVNKKGIISVTKCTSIDTPEGAIENGYIQNYTEMQVFLKNLAFTEKLTKGDVHLVIRSADAISREITVPILKSPKLDKVIKNEILGVFGNASDYYIDYAFTGKVEEELGQVYKLMAYALPRNMVIQYYELFLTAGMKPTVFDLHRNVITKLLQNGPYINSKDISDKAMILVDVGSNNLDLDLIVDCRSVFKRAITIGSELDTSSMNYDVSGSSFSMFDDGNAEIMLGYQNPTSRALFSKINEEIYKMTQFSISRENGKKVELIYLYGGNARIKGMADYLSNSLEMPVARIISLSNIEITAEVDICDVIPVAASLLRM